MENRTQADLEEFARRFRRFRKLLTLSQSKLSRQLDVPENSIYRWESAKGFPSFSALRKVYDLAEEKGIWPELFMDHDRVFYLQAARGTDDEDENRPVFVKMKIVNILTVVPAVLKVVGKHQATPLRMEASQPQGKVGNVTLLRLAFSVRVSGEGPKIKEDFAGLEGVSEVESPDIP